MSFEPCYFENIANEKMFLFRILELKAIYTGCEQLHKIGEGALQECFATWGDICLTSLEKCLEKEGGWIAMTTSRT